MCVDFRDLTRDVQDLCVSLAAGKMCTREREGKINISKWAQATPGTEQSGMGQSRTVERFEANVEQSRRKKRNE